MQFQNESDRLTFHGFALGRMNMRHYELSPMRIETDWRHTRILPWQFPQFDNVTPAPIRFGTWRSASGQSALGMRLAAARGEPFKHNKNVITLSPKFGRRIDCIMKNRGQPFSLRQPSSPPRRCSWHRRGGRLQACACGTRAQVRSATRVPL